MTRPLLALLLLLLVAGPLAPEASARARRIARPRAPRVQSFRPKTVSVRGHVTRRGRFVMPHRRATPRRR